MGSLLPHRHRFVAPVIAIVVLASILPAVTLFGGADPAAALPDDFTLTKTGPPDVLIGDEATFTLTASGSQATDVYNLSFRDVLPPGITYLSADPAPAIVVTDQPSPGATTLVWLNVDDLPTGSESSISYTVDTDADTDPSTAPAGSLIQNQAQAVANSDAFTVPDADPGTGAFTGDYTGEASALLTTPIIPYRLSKEVADGELLRGVHQSSLGTQGGTTGTTSTLRLEASPNYANTDFTITDVLDPTLEFLGCASYLPADNTTDVPFNGTAPATEEWTGSGPVAAGPTGPDCLTPDTVTTLGDGSTEVVWDVPLLAAGSDVTIVYGVGIPMRANCATFTGPTPTAGSLQQGRNLDNNCGPSTNELDMTPWPDPARPELLTSNEPAAGNTASTCGTYVPGVTGPFFGDSQCQDDTVVASSEDLVIDTSLSGSLEHGQSVTSTLTVTVGEYRDFQDFEIRDLLPSALCYTGTFGTDTSGTDWATNDCPGAGTTTPTIAIDGGTPAPAPATTVHELADGRFELVWSHTSLPALATLDADSTITLQFDSVVRKTYRAGGAPSTPLYAGDSITNAVEVAADDLLIVENSEGIDDAPGDELGNPDGDTASAALESDLPSIRKFVAVKSPGPLDEHTTPDPNDPSDCATHFSAITWEDSAGGAPSPSDVVVGGYSPGDLVCFALTADFPALLDYASVEIMDLLPPGYDYVSGSAARITSGSGPIAGGGSIPPDTIGAFVVSSEAAQRVVWDLGDVDDTGRQFTWVIAAVVGAPGSNAVGDITYNQQKMTTSNTAGTVFQFRDMAGLAWEEPIVQLAKGIDRIDSTSDDVDAPGPQGIDADGSFPDDDPTPQEVEAGARVHYRIDLWNEGNHDATDAEIWDRLPAGLGCADLVGGSIAPATGTCVTVGSADYVQWPADLDLPHDHPNVSYPPTPAQVVTYTYQLDVPSDAAPGRSYENEAGVRTYRADVNASASPFVYAPADNIDPLLATTNTLDADDQADIVTADPAVAKVQRSGIADTGNDRNDPADATSDEAAIGEIVEYTMTATLPEGTTASGAVLSDTIPTGLMFFSGTGLFGGSVTTLSPTVTVRPDPGDPGATAGNDDPCGDPGLAHLVTPIPGTGGDVVLTFPCDYVNAVGSGDDLIEVVFHVQVADVAGNQADPTPTRLRNRARLDWNDELGSPRQRDSNVVDTFVVEPNPVIVKDHTVPTPPDDTIVPGGNAVWRLTVTNPSTGAANVTTLHDLEVIDTVPARTTPLATPGGSPVTTTGDTVEGPGGAVGVWDASARTITWSAATAWNPPGGEAVLDELAPDGAPIVIDVEVEFDPSLPASADVTNTGQVTGDSLAPEDPSNDPGDQDARSSPAQDDDTLAVEVASLAKDVEPLGPPDPGDGGPWTVGEPVEFALTFTVPDDLVTFDATVFDTLPAELTFDRFGNSSLGPDPIIGPTCARGDLSGPTGPLGAADIVTLHPVGGDTQVFAWYLGDTVTSGGPCEITLPYTAHVDDDAVDGDIVTNQAVAAWNHANEVVDQTVADDQQLPAGHDDPAEFDDGTPPETETVAVVEPRLEIDKDVQRLPGPTAIAPCDTLGGNDTAAADDTDGVPGPAPSGTTTGDGCDVEAGSSLRYTLTVDNDGTGPAHDIVVVDTVPDGLNPIRSGATVTGSSGSTGTWSDAERTITWAIAGPSSGGLAAGGTTVLDYDATFDPSDDLLDLEDLQNLADIEAYFGLSAADRTQIATDNAANDDIPTYGNGPSATRGAVDPDEVTVEVHFPDPHIDKTHLAPSDPTDARVDEPFTWRLTVTNLDTVAALHGVDVTDTLPPGWTYVPGSAMVTTPYNAGPAQLDPACSADTGACNDPDALNTETLTWTDLTTGAGQPLDASQQIVIDLQAVPQSDVLDQPSLLGVGNEHTNTATVTGDDTTGSSTCCGGTPYVDQATDDVVVNTFDLALRKLVSGIDTADLGVGTDVTFTIEVINQGSVPATDVTITDYVQSAVWRFDPAANTAAATGNANDWDGTDPDMPTLDLGPVPAGGSVTVDLVLELRTPPPPDEEIHNVAEISAADDDGNPATPAPDDVDSLADAIDGNDVVVNDEIDQRGYDGAGTPTGDDEDDHDIASLPIFDLALVKTVDSLAPQPLVVGSMVTFEIEVLNRGSQTAHGIEIVDYVQPMFRFDPVDNPGWDGIDPLQPTFDIATLAPGTSATVGIVLEYVGGSAPAENRSEISAADDDTDPGNADPVDLDSRPDRTDDDVVVDDEITQQGVDGNGVATGDDEDDHDLARLDVFDLALRKTAATVPDPLSVGDVVEFDIEVLNQGSVDAYDVEVTDHVPPGLAYRPVLNTAAATGNATDWSGATGATAPTIVVPTIPAGTSVTVRIRLEVDNGTGALRNRAEITSADDDTDPTNLSPTDVDSTPDADPDDDAVEDDEVDENGRDDTSGDGTADEDDHDIAALARFDLALRKQVAPIGPDPLRIGSVVEYRLEVINQGDVDATDVVVVDHVPPALGYTDAANTSIVTGNTEDWDGSTDPTAPTLLVGDVDAGESVTVVLRLTLQATPADGVVRNEAEIVIADDDADPTTAAPVDVDSTADADGDNDPVIDDEIGDDGATDEDDHDIDLLPVFDLALRKTVDEIAPLPLRVGSDITYQLEVVNQGGVDATDVVITDRVGAGLAFEAADNPGWDASDPAAPTLTIPSVAAQSTEVVSITLRVVGGAPTLDNDAELTGADDDGDPDTAPPTDVDSTADAVDGNDPVVDDEIDDDGTTDEDDHDVTSLPVFDLALRKSLGGVAPAPLADGSDVTFAIEVINQGSIDATDIVVTDHIGGGLAFDAAANTAAATGNGADWDATDPLAPTLAVGNLAAGATTTVHIVMTVPEVPAEPATYTNRAEISAADDDGDPATTAPVDLDSDPDADPDDDPLVDDEVDDNGTADEDDHDIAAVATPRFDLALVKSVRGDPLVDHGDALTFAIEVFNQGEIDAAGIEITDHLPASLTLAATGSGGWVDNGDGTLTGTIAGPVAPGSSATIELVTTVQGPTTGDQVNRAEISRAVDVNGLVHPDQDSTPDDDPDDDPGGDPATDDDVIDGTGGDEDDHDPAVFRIRAVDLAATKELSSGATAGGVATWSIVVANEGPDPDPGPIIVTDDLPSGLTFRSGGGGGWSCTAAGSLVTCDRPGELAAGAATAPLTIETDVIADVGVQLSNTVAVASAAADIGAGNDTSVAGALVTAAAGALAFTGTTTARLLVGALLLMATGAGLVVIRRRRVADAG